MCARGPREEHDLRAPETILEGCTTITGVFDAEEEECEDQVEETETEIDAMNCNPTVTFLAVAFDFHIIQSKMLQFLHCPWRKHNPRDDGIDQ
jgi:hypothetical protein